MRPSVGIVVVIAVMGVLVSSASVAGQAGRPQSPPTRRSGGRAGQAEARAGSRPTPKPTRPATSRSNPSRAGGADRNAVNIGERFTVADMQCRGDGRAVCRT
jgi:hypothetical protein